MKCPKCGMEEEPTMDIQQVCQNCGTILRKATAKIQIPFKQEMAALAILGKKTATSRNSRYGEPGDEFELSGVTFKLIRQVHVHLKTVAALYYDVEGFDSPQEFIDYWIYLHPRAGWEPDKLVWLHHFVRITDLSTLPDEFLLSLEKEMEQ